MTSSMPLCYSSLYFYVFFIFVFSATLCEISSVGGILTSENNLSRPVETYRVGPECSITIVAEVPVGWPREVIEKLKLYYRKTCK